MPYELTCAIWLPLPVEEAFRFFESADNLERITPPWLGFEVLTPHVEMKSGTLIDYHVRWGIRMKWRTLIEEYQPPRMFVDRQLKGPYKLWHHRHIFEAVKGGTLARDRVMYLPPLGPLGRLMHWAMIRRNLRQIFEYRQEKIAAILLGHRAKDAREVEPIRIRWSSAASI